MGGTAGLRRARKAAGVEFRPEGRWGGKAGRKGVNVQFRLGGRAARKIAYGRRRRRPLTRPAR